MVTKIPSSRAKGTSRRSLYAAKTRAQLPRAQRPLPLHGHEDVSADFILWIPRKKDPVTPASAITKHWFARTALRIKPASAEPDLWRGLKESFVVKLTSRGRPPRAFAETPGADLPDAGQGFSRARSGSPMEIWMAITIGAAFVQNVRLQKCCKKHLAEFPHQRVHTRVRRFFLFRAASSRPRSWPGSGGGGAPMPALTAGFWVLRAAGGLAKIVANGLRGGHLRRTATSPWQSPSRKTEVLQDPRSIGFMVLGERVSPGALVAIGVGLAGLLLRPIRHDPKGAGSCGAVVQPCRRVGESPRACSSGGFLGGLPGR